MDETRDDVSGKSRVPSGRAEVKSRNPILQTETDEESQVAGSLAGYILSLQETVGNRAVQRMIRAGLPQIRLRTGQASGHTIARSQPLDEPRRSRITVAASVQSFRTGYGIGGRGRLALALIDRLRDTQERVQDAAAVLAEGHRQFGSQTPVEEEPAGLALGQPSSIETTSRRAVVVGNANYDEDATMGGTALPQRGRDLPGAIDDAREISDALRGRGYDVVPEDDRTAPQIEALLVAALNGGHGFDGPLPDGGELVFFFRGHGLIQGLIGVDGSAFTPLMMLSIRNQAYRRRIDFTAVLNACHSGVFVDVIRSAELLSARRAALLHRATPEMNVATLHRMTSLLDRAIEVQCAKNRLTLDLRAWWNRRYELELPHTSQQAMREALAEGRTEEQILADLTAHLNTLPDIWNEFVQRVEPSLLAVYDQARDVGVPLTGQVALQTYTGQIADPDRELQNQLDDVDIILNQVLEHVDTQLR